MRRGRVLFAVAALGASLGWVAFGGLRSSLVYYRTPSEVASASASFVGQRFRLGGLVEPGSVRRSPSGTWFTVTDGTKSVPVLDTGATPSMFRAGRGVVVEGTLDADGLFHADTVLVKHEDTYRPPTIAATGTGATP